MEKSVRAHILGVLDLLALVLVDKHHEWTQAERRAYEAAVRLLS